MSVIHRFTVLKIQGGIARIRKRCPWCERKHVAQFPADDILVAKRHARFCKKCDRDVQRALDDHPWLRPRL